MRVSRPWPNRGRRRRRFGLSVFLLAMMPTTIGYQDLAALIARQPAVSERWRQHAYPPTFATFRTATFSFPRPVGTLIPSLPGYTFASLDPRSVDVTGSIGRAGRIDPFAEPTPHIAFPQVDRTRKGDLLAPRRPAQPPEPQIALVNDLDLRLLGPGGEVTLPFVLDVNNIEAVATRGTNHVDNIEQIVLANAPAGVYSVEVAGTRVTGGSQTFTLVGSGQFGTPVQTCTDVYEPNESEAASFGPLTRNEEITARTCSAQDVDFYRILANETGPVSVVVRATDTAIRATLTGGPSPVTVDVQPGQTATLTTSLGAGAGAPAADTTFLLRVASISAPGNGATYTVKPSFGFSAGRRRGARPL